MLFKSDPIDLSLKSEYEASLATDKIQLYRAITVLTIIMLIFTINLDSWAIPSRQQEVLNVRVFIMACMFVSFFTTFYHEFFIKHYSLILVPSFLALCFSVEYVIHLSHSTELAYYTYFSVIIISMMNMFSWTYLSTKVLMCSTVAIVTGYIFAITTRDEQGPYGAFVLISVTVTLMSGAVLFGYLGMLIRDRHRKEKFLLQQSFKSLFEEKAKEAKTHEYHASHDALTNLPNRRFLEKALMNQLNEIERQHKIMLVMFLDLDGFKKINDEFGHVAGDHVLKVIAKRLSFCLFKNDTLIRLGGDEFLICATIDNDNDIENIIDIITEKLTKSIEKAIKFEDIDLFVSTSIGVAQSNHDGHNINDLIEIADQRMYDQKKSRFESQRLKQMH